jgi:hypothetical protein
MIYLRMQQPEQSGRWPDGRLIRWLASLFKRKPQAIKRLEVQPHFQRISREATREFRAAAIRPPTLKIIVDLAELTDEDRRLVGHCVDQLPGFIRPADLFNYRPHRKHLLNNVVSRRLIVSLDGPPGGSLLRRIQDNANLACGDRKPELLFHAFRDLRNGLAGMRLDVSADRVGFTELLFCHFDCSLSPNRNWKD